MHPNQHTFSSLFLCSRSSFSSATSACSVPGTTEDKRTTNMRGGGRGLSPDLRTQQTNELVVLVFKLLELLPRVLQLVLHLLDDFHIGIVQLGLTRLVWRGEGGGRG